MKLWRGLASLLSFSVAAPMRRGTAATLGRLPPEAVLRLVSARMQLHMSGRLGRGMPSVRVLNTVASHLSDFRRCPSVPRAQHFSAGQLAVSSPSKGQRRPSVLFASGPGRSGPSGSLNH